MIRTMAWMVLLAGSLPVVADDGETFSQHVLDVTPEVTLAGAIDPEALRQQISGRVLVVDLRTPAEQGVQAEEEAVRALGMGYRNLPVAGPVIDPAQVTYLETLLRTRPADEHLVIHCASGNRAGMMWGAVLLDSGEDVDAVLEEVSPIITHEPLADALRGYADAPDGP